MGRLDSVIRFGGWEWRCQSRCWQRLHSLFPRRRTTRGGHTMWGQVLQERACGTRCAGQTSQQLRLPPLWRGWEKGRQRRGFLSTEHTSWQALFPTPWTPPSRLAASQGASGWPRLLRSRRQGTKQKKAMMMVVVTLQTRREVGKTKRRKRRRHRPRPRPRPRPHPPRLARRLQPSPPQHGRPRRRMGFLPWCLRLWSRTRRLIGPMEVGWGDGANVTTIPIGGGGVSGRGFLSTEHTSWQA